MVLFSQRKQVSLHRQSRRTLSTFRIRLTSTPAQRWHGIQVNEFEGLSGLPPAGHSQWLALADALDAAVVTLHTAVPDPLWFGPSRYAFDHNAEQVMADLRQARWAILATEPGSS